MKQAPILFTDAMVSAIEAGRKTQTRRLREPNWERGDVLYARHAWALNLPDPPAFRVDHPTTQRFKWKPSIHMPRAIARVWLEVTAVRPEQLQAITVEDAIAEGLQEKHAAWGLDGLGFWFDPREAYFQLWDRINPKHLSKSDPRVWVTSFKPVDRPPEASS